jgi:hypothetical protein
MKPQLPGQIFFQCQIQLMGQGFACQFAHAQQLAMQSEIDVPDRGREFELRLLQASRQRPVRFPEPLSSPQQPQASLEIEVDDLRIAALFLRGFDHPLQAKGPQLVQSAAGIGLDAKRASFPRELLDNRHSNAAARASSQPIPRVHSRDICHALCLGVGLSPRRPNALLEWRCIWRLLKLLSLHT